MCLAVSSCYKKQENTPDPKAKEYENALVLLANCDYVGAKAAFEALGDYRYAREDLSKFYYMPVSFEYDLTDKKGTNDVAYNSLNLPINEITIRSDVQSVSKFVYDEKGNCTREVFTDAEGEQSTHDFTYDQHGNVVNEVFTYSDGSVQYINTKYELLYIPCGITAGTDYFFRGFWGDRL